MENKPTINKLYSREEFLSFPNAAAWLATDNMLQLYIPIEVTVSVPGKFVMPDVARVFRKTGLVAAESTALTVREFWDLAEKCEREGTRLGPSLVDQPVYLYEYWEYGVEELSCDCPQGHCCSAGTEADIPAKHVGYFFTTVEAQDQTVYPFEAIKALLGIDE